MPNKKTTYQNVPEWDSLKSLDIVDDFLPQPEELVMQPKLKKITIALSEESLDFFKQQAKKFNTSYQPMIRNLLDEYARRIKYQHSR